MQSVNNQKRLYWKLSGETGGNLKIAFNSFRLEKDLGNTIPPFYYDTVSQKSDHVWQSSMCKWMNVINNHVLVYK